MTDSLPAPDDRTPVRRDDERDTAPGDTDQRPDTPDDHEEQPGFRDGPTSPAEGGD